MTPQVGAPAPAFTLPDTDRRPVSLADFRGRPVLLVFYPFAFTPLCGSELVALRDHLPELTEACAVLTVSCDSVHSHRAWGEQQGFTFPLLSDFWPHGGVARDYGVFDEEVGVAVRGSFVVDGAGVLRWAVRNAIPDVRDLDTYRSVLAGL